ncbi:putative T6SS immunity periplasmic lipoprotein [Morganella psychrotolerans]|uniref:putative T6SS immunity periplasmic lipoprotein n=1 Tax=Morganella psychrotolerans TaxID=368603 RepID=UPI0039B0237F
MHKFIIIPLVFLLSGCWHTNDPRPIIVNGDISMSAGKLCVKTPNASDDEYITYINVFGFKEQKTIADIDYSASPVKLDEDKCLPTPDIQYQENGKYAYTASTVLQRKQAKKINPHRRSIGVTFFIKEVDGDKQAVDALNM